MCYAVCILLLFIVFWFMSDENVQQFFLQLLRGGVTAVRGLYCTREMYGKTWRGYFIITNIIYRARELVVYRFRGRGGGNERRLLAAAIYDRFPPPLPLHPSTCDDGFDDDDFDYDDDSDDDDNGGGDGWR